MLYSKVDGVAEVVHVVGPAVAVGSTQSFPIRVRA
jgi:hypothetical protein